MIRMLLRSVSAVMAIVASVLAIGMIREDDSSFPLGTARSFSLNTGTSSKAKAELLAGLNRVADAERMVLVKATADLSSSGGARDLVWFGSRAPRPAERSDGSTRPCGASSSPPPG